jgi:hypothetical protein
MLDLPKSPSERMRRRLRRECVAMELAERHGGVVHRAQLRAAGIGRDGVRTETAAGRWTPAGRHTLVVGARVPAGQGRWWWAVWESGSGAVLDGVSALLAIGLTGYSESTVHVTVPRECRPRPLPGVVVHRRRDLGPVSTAGIPRTRPEAATIHAAQWAVSDRQAALLVCLPVQQRLVPASALLGAWSGIGRTRRRALLDAVIHDVCDGAHSLGELDFAGLCRRYGLPRPLRQSVRRGRSGRVYLDVEFPGGLVVEIDGGHHLLGLNPIDDALRANEVTLGSARVLRIPVLGLRLEPAAFMGQVARALGLGHAAGGS